MKERDLAALILMGGKSLRMGKDKSKLDIVGVPQREFLYNSFKNFFDEVYFSLTEEQSKDDFFKDKLFVVDYILKGPASGIYTALQKINKSLFVIACDMPFTDFEALSLLLKFRQKNSAVCFEDFDGFLQPLFAIYEIETIEIFKEFLDKNENSLNKILQAVNAAKIKLKDHLKDPGINKIFTNINTIEELEEFKKT